MRQKLSEVSADECRFTRLSRACQGDDWILLEALSQVCLDLTWNHIILLIQNSILNQQNNTKSPIGSLRDAVMSSQAVDARGDDRCC